MTINFNESYFVFCESKASNVLSFKEATSYIRLLWPYSLYSKLLDALTKTCSCIILERPDFSLNTDNKYMLFLQVGIHELLYENLVLNYVELIKCSTDKKTRFVWKLA